MKKTFIIVSISFVIIAYFFYKKTYINNELVYEIPDNNAEFRPLAYVFFHSVNDLKKYFSINAATKEIEKKSSTVDFDFNKYSYCIFFGKKVVSMYYSQKQIYFDDPTPSYARTKGKIPVFVEYEKDRSDNIGVFIYRVPKNEKLRGFYD